MYMSHYVYKILLNGYQTRGAQMIIGFYAERYFGEDDTIDSEYSLNEHYFDWYGNYTDAEIEALLE